MSNKLLVCDNDHKKIMFTNEVNNECPVCFNRKAPESIQGNVREARVDGECLLADDGDVWYKL